MKNYNLSFEKLKSKVLINPQIALKTATKYCVFFALMVLFARAKTVGGLSPFSIGFFVGLVFAKQNMLILAPLYVIAGLTNSFGWETLVFTLSPVVVLSLVYLISFKLSRSVSAPVLCAAALISLTPYAVITLLSSDLYLAVALNVVLSVFFAYCCQIGSYAVLFRGINYRLTLDEGISLSVFLCAFSIALFSNPIFSFNLYFVFLGFAILFLACSFQPSVPMLAATILGLGAALASGELAYVAASALLSAVAVALKPFTKYAAAVGVALSECLLALFLETEIFDYMQAVALSVGLAIFLLTPKSGASALSAALGSLGGEKATRNIVNQNRAELSQKLSGVSQVFFNMSSLLSASAPSAERFSAERLAEGVACSYCANCADSEACFSALSGDTRGVLLPMVEAGLKRDKVTILDMPPFITSRCNNMQGLVSVINKTDEQAKRELQGLTETTSSRQMIAEQFDGVSLVLDGLSREIKKRVSFSAERESRIARELARHNIIATEAVVYGEGEDCQVTLTVRSKDTDKLVLDKLVSNALGVRMERTEEVFTPQNDDWQTVHLVASPRFYVAFGASELKREGEEVSGDTKTVLKLGSSRLLIALSDGMGSGDEAQTASATAIGLVENFYRAGFDGKLVLSLVNKMLTLRDGDDYSTLDLVVINRQNGELDLVKMGAADSFLVHDTEIRVVESGAPPVGILDKIAPVTHRMQAEDGDLMVLVSDGVCDALTSDGVAEAIDEIHTLNPQILADALTQRARAKGALDDCTALVFRLVEN